MLQDSASDSASQHSIDVVNGDERMSDGALSDTPEDSELPQCKTKRNYCCAKCSFFTQNPRVYLLHMRDYHEEKLKIYDCPYCVYASRQGQKLMRHITIVHGPNNPQTTNKPRGKEKKEEDLSYMLEQVSDDCSGDESATLKQHKQNYSCEKCNYVTHIKSRFTKHVKYHSMPMIKCDLCNFRTPYKWNLDRHMKNHGGSGSFCCSMCNFNADIKQSLTVHEMNHHTPETGISGVNRRRNKVGASDMQEEDSIDSELAATMELCSDNSSSELCDEQINEDIAANFLTATTESKKSSKLARPIPNLIPIIPATPKAESPTEPSAKKLKLDDSSAYNKETCSEKSNGHTVTKILTGTPKELPRKKNESFFDRLKERLLTETGDDGALVCKNCGFQSKCLSEHSVHEKNCASASSKTVVHSHGSTRCQHCRHRCKSSADLVIHLKSCKANIDHTNLVKDKDIYTETNHNEIQIEGEKHNEPHPMENKVFVWNTTTEEPQSNYSSPLEISINENSLLGSERSSNDADNSQDNDMCKVSPSQIGKKVFKCPHCVFFAATASRFHVHIVGHLNKKPFECSLCNYRSNWRWDITKHIRLKSVRDLEHNKAEVLMTDETGRRNYTKYNKYLTVLNLDEVMSAAEHLPSTSNCGSIICTDENEECENGDEETAASMQNSAEEESPETIKKSRRTLWKCKKCNFKDPSKEALLEHVRDHARKQTNEMKNGVIDQNKESDSAMAYRCGHCFQISNWKHVIQRHCRLKHNGVIKVDSIEKSKLLEAHNIEVPPDATTCSKCPFISKDRNELLNHAQQHIPSPDSIFKCYFCPYFVKNEIDLMLHLPLHGIHDPEGFVARAMGSKPTELAILDNVPLKRHKCPECPYESNSKSQFLYHKNFHRLPTNAPYKCLICNYSVTKRHLLAQHMKVHLPREKKDGVQDDQGSQSRITSYAEGLENIPFVWVLAKNEYHKMYRCRYCSYVNSQLEKIPNHERMHCIEIVDADTIYKCLECKFTCDNAPELTDHCKIHGEIYGRIYCTVNSNIPEEEQISKLRELHEEEQRVLAEASNRKMDGQDNDDNDKTSQAGKLLYFCTKCPARFFADTDWKIHNKFHDLQFPMQCRYCTYTVPQDTQLAVHNYVHTEDYRSKTLMLQRIHETHPDYRKPKTVSIPGTSLLDTLWVVNGEVKSVAKENVKSDSKSDHIYKPNPKPHSCVICPAKFCKLAALNYHNNLHGSNHTYRCKTCNFAVNTLSKLSKHEKVHDDPVVLVNSSNDDYDSSHEDNYKNVPLSGTDLFQRKTEAQKRGSNTGKTMAKPNHHFPPVLEADPQFGLLMHGNPEFIYPTYMKNGRQKEKRYKCHKCPSAFEKREQYKVHLSLHGSKQRYKCEMCDYSVKYYANYVQHMRKHQMNEDAHAERKKALGDVSQEESSQEADKPIESNEVRLAIKTMPKPVPKTDFEKFSIKDQQTLILLQNNRSHCTTTEEASTSEKREKKLFSCDYCPHFNSRNDNIESHEKRHQAKHNSDPIVPDPLRCNFCNFIASQTNFLKEHLKLHFKRRLDRNPSCFMKLPNEVKIKITTVDENDQELESTIIIENPINEKDIVLRKDLRYVDISTGTIIVKDEK